MAFLEAAFQVVPLEAVPLVVLVLAPLEPVGVAAGVAWAVVEALIVRSVLLALSVLVPRLAVAPC